VDDAWQLFIQYREAMAQTRREHDDIIIAYKVPTVTYEEVPLAVSMNVQRALPQDDAEEQQEYVVLALDET
jgi:hypothetical protein